MMKHNAKRALLAMCSTVLLLTLTGCFIQPIPAVETVSSETALPLPSPTVLVTPALPTSTVIEDFSAWATQPPPETATPAIDPAAQGAALTPEPSPTATPQPTAAADPLKSGAEGPEVRGLQQRLSDLGYYTRTIDGAFGAATTAALKDFQKANNLANDGIAGPRTMEVLNSGNAVPKKDNN